ncbi:MAG: hypothetical protein ACYCU7_03250 [Acidimicrobiales bacterium]
MLWLGIGVSVAGTMVAASNGVVLVVSYAMRTFGSAVQWTVNKLRSRENVAVQGTATVSLSAPSVSISISKSWDPKAPIEQQVDFLHEDLGKLRQEVTEFRNQMATRHLALTEAMQSVESGLASEVQAVRDRLNEAERSAALVNAWGFPLIGWGIVMVGIPGPLARVDGLGWVVIGGAVFLTLLGIRAIFRRGIQIRNLG